jgi:hypothetical protein
MQRRSKIILILHTRGKKIQNGVGGVVGEVGVLGVVGVVGATLDTYNL